MDGNFLALIEESRALNSRVFSLVRLQLLASLASLGADGATYRELKAALQLSDGALYSNLNVLIAMGYVKSGRVTVEKKELESYRITAEGVAQWNSVKEWLCKFLACGRENERR